MNRCTRGAKQRVNMHAAIANHSCRSALPRPQGILSFPWPSFTTHSLRVGEWVAALLSPPQPTSLSERFALLSFLLFFPCLRIMHHPVFWLSHRTVFALKCPPCPYSISSLCVFLLSFVCLFLPLLLSLSSSGQENDYAKQDLDPSMCHRLVLQVPSEGSSLRQPPLLVLLRPFFGPPTDGVLAWQRTAARQGTLALTIRIIETLFDLAFFLMVALSL